MIFTKMNRLKIEFVIPVYGFGKLWLPIDDPPILIVFFSPQRSGYSSAQTILRLICE